MTIDAAAQSCWEEFKVLNDLFLLQNPCAKLRALLGAYQPCPAAQAAASTTRVLPQPGQGPGLVQSAVVTGLAKPGAVWSARFIKATRWSWISLPNMTVFEMRNCTNISGTVSSLKITFSAVCNTCSVPYVGIFMKCSRQKVKNSAVYWHDNAILHECSAFHLKWLV